MLTRRELTTQALILLFSVLMWISFSVTHSNLTLYLLAGTLIAISLLAPVNQYLSIILLTVTLVPWDYLNSNSTLIYFNPGLAVAVVFLLRRLLTEKMSELRVKVLAAGGLFAIYLSILAILKEHQHGLFQSVVLALISALVWFVFPAFMSTESVIEKNWLTILGLSICLGSFGILEFMTRKNTFSWFFESSFQLLTQKWGTYRITTTLGHPLVNGLIFAILGVLCLYLAASRIHTFAAYSAVAVATTAEAMTGSRSGLLAMGIGYALLLWLKFLRSSKWSMWFILLVSSLLALFLSLEQFGVYQRFSLSESAESTTYRFYLLEQIPKFITNNGILGVGPFSSATEWQKQDLSGLPLENSTIQLLFSYGLLGLVALSLFLTKNVVGNLRTPKGFGSAPVLLAFIIAASGFNFFEAFPSFLALTSVIVSLLYGNALISPATSQNINNSPEENR